MQASQPRNPQPRKYRTAIIVGVVLWVLLFGGGLFFLVQGGWRLLTPRYVRLQSVQMLSANEGWAVGVGSPAQGDDNLIGLIYHYKDGKWQEDVSNLSERPSFLEDIFMISPNEGWAVGALTVLHYKDGEWQVEVERRASAGDTEVAADSIYMISSKEGWAAGPLSLAHYEDGKWQSLDDTIPAGRGYDIQMLSADEGWTVGFNIYHYKNGAWQEVQRLNDESLNSISMVSPTEGWAVGRTLNFGSADDKALIYKYNGAQWQPQQHPLDNAAGSKLNDIHMVSAEEGWVIGSDGKDQGYAHVILHYKSGTWTEQARFSIGRGAGFESGLSMISADEGWAVAGDKIFHYTDGKWKSHQN